MESRIQKLLSALNLLLACVVILTFLGVYWMIRSAPFFGDEIHWQLQNAHIPYDGFRMINLYPACLSNFTWSVPLPLIPGRLFAALFHPDNLLQLRILGMAKYAACIGLFACFAYRIFDRQFSRWVLLAVSAALLSLGFLPAVLIFTRPETSALIGALLLLLIYIHNQQSTTRNAAASWRLVLIIAALLSWMLSIHPKMTFFIPLVLLLCFTLTTHDAASRWAMRVIAVVMSISCVMLWSVHSSCPESRSVMRMLSGTTLLPADLFYNPTATIEQALLNMGTIVDKFNKPLNLSYDYMRVFSGQQDVATIPGIFLHGTNLLIRILEVLLVSILPMTCLTKRPAMETNGASAILPRYTALLLSLPALQILATKKIWGWYDAGYPWVLVLLIIVMRLSQLNWHRLYPARFIQITAFILLTGIASNAVFYSIWSGFYQHMASARAYENGAIPELDLFYSMTNYAARDMQTQHVARMCEIPLDQTAQHVLVDNTTYFPLRKTYQPFFGYLFFFPPEHSSILEFLRGQQSTGAVAPCNLMPPDMRNIALDYNGVCCVGPRQLYPDKFNQK